LNWAFLSFKLQNEMYIRTHTCTHTHMHTCTYTHSYTLTLYTHTHTHTHTHICVHAGEPTRPTLAEEEPLGSVQGSDIKDLPSPISVGPGPTPGTAAMPIHRRFKSDITGMLPSEERTASRSPVPEEDLSPLSSTPTPTPTEDTIFTTFEPVSHSRSSLLKSVSTPTPSVGHELEEEEEEGGRFSLPSIDVEVNVTINVDYGIIILRTEERCVLQM